MSDQISSMAAEHAESHWDGGPLPPMFGDVEFVEHHISDGGGVLHLCRYSNGDIAVMLDDDLLLQLAESDVRWLASQFLGALDNWPKHG